MTPQDAAVLLRIKLPTTSNALKSAFRRRAGEVHPDRSLAVDAHEQFIRVQDAYDVLRKSREYIEDADAVQVCVDGVTKVADCGQGLGPTVNGKTCDMCDGQGFTRWTAEEIECPECREVSEAFRFQGWEYRCPTCRGSGLVKYKPCRRCRGASHNKTTSGWIFLASPTRRSRVAFSLFSFAELRHEPDLSFSHCGACRGLGHVSNKNKWLYGRCEQCKGAGEVACFNPVLPKGLIRSHSNG